MSREFNQPKGHWQQKRPVWAVELDDGTLLGMGGAPSLFATRKDAKHVSSFRGGRVVRVLVKYEEVR